MSNLLLSLRIPILGMEKGETIVQLTTVNKNKKTHVSKHELEMSV